MRKGTERPAAPIQAPGRVLRPVAMALLGAAVLAGTPPAAAAQRGGQFEVRITVDSPGGFLPPDSSTGSLPPGSAFCRTTDAPGAFGATVTVVCSTGAVVDVSSDEAGMPWVPLHGGAYRYLVQVRKADEVLATVDSYTGAGTVTSWRVVRLADRDYVELTVGW